MRLAFKDVAIHEDLSPADEHLTDLGNAERLVALFGDDIRHCEPWRSFFVWDGKR
jgi:hypothetical protein